jgi:hypothetical protein
MRTVIITFFLMIDFSGLLFLRPGGSNALPAEQAIALPSFFHAMQAAQSATTYSPAFQPGEKLQYRISWDKILVAGIAELSVKPGSGNKDCQLYLKAETTSAVAKLYNFKDEFTSSYDMLSGMPSRYAKRFTQNKRVVDEVINFNQLNRSALLVDAKKQSKILLIETGTQDPLSALYSVRSVGLKPGMKLILPLNDGGRNYLLTIQVVAAELITVQAGSFKTLRAEVNMQLNGMLLPNKKMTVWLSDDAKRVPVLASVVLPIGTGLVELVAMP